MPRKFRSSTSRWVGGQGVQVHISISRSARTFYALLLSALVAQGEHIPNLFPYPNDSGFVATFNASGKAIDLSGPFFQPLGSNGRSCFSCHRPAQGWSISTEELKSRFQFTGGRDPIFRTIDGANCNNLDARAVGRPENHSMLLKHGLIRVELAVPENAEFDVLSVQNRYGCDSNSMLSTYRRPLPTTNLRALSAVMWDGRESAPQTGTQKITYATNPADLTADLEHQAVDAVNIHAEASSTISEETRQQIVKFMMGLTTAQVYDYRAGRLDAGGALGGPIALAKQVMPTFYVGINDPLGGNPLNTPFTSVIFGLFDSWSNSSNWRSSWRHDPSEQRAKIARGQTIFNAKPIDIQNVAGLNDDLNVSSIPGTCGTCHDAPNVGSHSLPVPLNIGVGDLDSSLNVSYLPVFTLQNKVTHEVKRTTDPGRAMISGAWKDIGRMKGPVLRGLASRAPYFHNGSARSLTDVVNFYNTRFIIGLSDEEKDDLIAFLNSL
jgi:cytochrome c peroxidase